MNKTDIPLTQNDFLTGANFIIGKSNNAYWTYKTGKHLYLTCGGTSHKVIEIHKDSFCIDYNGAPKSIDFSDCSLIEDAQ